MKRWLSSVVVSAFVVLAAAAIQQWNAHFRVPSADLRPLPHDLIALDSPAGQEMLARSKFRADYGSLMRNFESQSRPAFCGVASSVIVLNALHASPARLTQATFFTQATERIRSPLQVTYEGIGLADLAAFLRAHGVDATAFYASDVGIDEFRAIVKRNLKTKGDFILVNYQRALLGEEKLGHISPIAAYDEATDELLVLDVAAYKYPPTWVPTAALWRAMDSVADEASGKTRGFVVVRERLE